MSKIKANVVFSINVNLLKCVFMKCNLDILNLEYSGVAFCCVLVVRIFFSPCLLLKALFNIYSERFTFQGKV